MAQRGLKLKIAGRSTVSNWVASHALTATELRHNEVRWDEIRWVIPMLLKVLSWKVLKHCAVVCAFCYLLNCVVRLDGLAWW